MSNYLNIDSVRTLTMHHSWPWEEWAEIPPGKAMEVNLNGADVNKAAHSIRTMIRTRRLDLKVVQNRDNLYVGRDRADA